jgi:hypothetical protein
MSRHSSHVRLQVFSPNIKSKLNPMPTRFLAAAPNSLQPGQPHRSRTTRRPAPAATRRMPPPHPVRSTFTPARTLHRAWPTCSVERPPPMPWSPLYSGAHPLLSSARHHPTLNLSVVFKSASGSLLLHSSSSSVVKSLKNEGIMQAIRKKLYRCLYSSVVLISLLNS